MTYPSGFGVQYIYTSLGYLSQIDDASSGQNYWTVNTRDAELQLTRQTFGNGVNQNNAFNAQTGLVTTIGAGPGNGTGVADFDYQYDFLGNLTYRDDVNEGVHEYYCFDGLNRLTTSATGTNGATVSACTSSGANIIDKTIGYDTTGLGNIASKSDVGSYSYPAAGHVQPHAVSSISGTVNTSFSYDGNGNMTAGNGRSLTYTSYNLTSSITDGSTNVSFAYGSEHARIQQVEPTGTTTYLNDPTSGAMAEWFVNGATTTWHDYILAPGKEPGAGAFIAERMGGQAGAPANWGSVTWGSFTWAGASSIMHYFTVDHLGSIAVVTDASATVDERDSYDAWGKRRSQTGADSSNCSVTSTYSTRGFTGQEMMDSVCAVNLNARVYDPTIARFMAADPITATPYDLQSLNRYGYVGNSPLTKGDLTGLYVQIIPNGENNFTFVFPVQFGGATDVIKSQFKSIVSQDWGGTHGNYTVNFQIFEAPPGTPENQMNYLQFKPLSNPDIGSGVNKNGTYAILDTSLTKWWVHEVGHLLGLPDMYARPDGINHGGFTYGWIPETLGKHDSVMALGNTVLRSDIADIIKNGGRGISGSAPDLDVPYQPEDAWVGITGDPITGGGAMGIPSQHSFVSPHGGASGTSPDGCGSGPMPMCQ